MGRGVGWSQRLQPLFKIVTGSPLCSESQQRQAMPLDTLVSLAKSLPGRKRGGMERKGGKGDEMGRETSNIV